MSLGAQFDFLGKDQIRNLTVLISFKKLGGGSEVSGLAMEVLGKPYFCRKVCALPNLLLNPWWLGFSLGKSHFPNRNDLKISLEHLLS